MANTKSAKKAYRNSLKKGLHNLFWKKRIAAAKKAKPFDAQAYKNLQSVLDKAVNKKVIHKNKAARIKSRMLKKLETLNK